MHCMIRVAISFSVMICLGLYVPEFRVGQSGLAPQAELQTQFQFLRAPQASLIALIAREDVRVELGLNVFQIQGLDDNIETYRTELRRWIEIGESLNFREQPESQFKKILSYGHQYQRQLAERCEQLIEETLNEQQYTRLKQLQIQRAGLSAFQHDDVIDALSLSKNQLSKIANFVPYRFSCSVTAAERAQAFNELMHLLSDVQQVQWLDLKGTDFQFEQIGDSALYGL